MIAMRGFPKEGQEVGEGAGLCPWGCLLALSLPVLWVLFLLYWPGSLQLLGFSLSPINARLPYPSYHAARKRDSSQSREYVQKLLLGIQGGLSILEPR